jgi:hypothetical protein
LGFKGQAGLMGGVDVAKITNYWRIGGSGSNQAIVLACAAGTRSAPGPSLWRWRVENNLLLIKRRHALLFSRWVPLQ